MDYSNVTLFETSWEVCNKVGGIYTVVSSKALQATDNYGDNYWLLGPDLGTNSNFEEVCDALSESVKKILRGKNLRCRVGRWIIPGRPRVILVDFKKRFDQNQLLHEYWQDFKVDSLSSGWDYIEPVMFATACGEVIAAIYRALIEPMSAPAIAHFHEWMCGAGILYLKSHCPAIGTVFTTHATMLGRSLCGNGQDLYKKLRTQFNPQNEASALGVTAKNSMEQASAREADCFTTVSDITAEEASVILGKKPDIVTPNGLDMRVVSDFAADRTKPLIWRKMLLAKAERLLRRKLTGQVRIALISGRYEFKNKGIDVFLEALGKVKNDLQGSNSRVLAICAVMGGHSGPNEKAVGGDPAVTPDGGGFWICSHHAYDPKNDPILNKCRELGLDNAPDNNVSVIFIPAQLDGNDGFLNMPYEQVLAASDMAVFPSWYEPWGYTPEESAAYAVPTATSDLAGFGLWVRNKAGLLASDTGVEVLSRRDVRAADVAEQLRGFISRTATASEEALAASRAKARATAVKCDWSNFFPLYLKAYDIALSKALEHGAKVKDDRLCNGMSSIVAAENSLTPVLHSFTTFSKMPKNVRRLREIASNLWWCWNPWCWKLFSDLAPSVWETSDHNPLACLEQASDEAIAEAVKDPAYLGLYSETIKAFDDYMKRKVKEGKSVTSAHPIAYFSTEYGLNESLPIYSGGLGVLSGDHLKSASDLNIPLVAVGLFYRYGYFRQKITPDGRQTAVYRLNDAHILPLEQVKASDGEPLEISLPLPGRTLFARVWLVKVGSIKLYLLDSYLSKNTPEDQKITDQLYVADRDFRIRQEILLGMGGVLLLRALRIEPSVYHMNEGHSAFLVLERIWHLMNEEGLSFKEAQTIVRSSSIFTTHTPVDAGNERFRCDLVQKYFGEYVRKVGIDMDAFIDLGRMQSTAEGIFEMTLLALRHAYKANGVSRLHGDVSRHMWQNLWKGLAVAEVPIGHVTNGVHMPSYTSYLHSEVLRNYLGKDWSFLKVGAKAWQKFDDIPEKIIWRTKNIEKNLLLDEIRSSIPRLYTTLGVSVENQKIALSRISDNTLLIGFGRRFAPYKRGNMLFANLDRLYKILSNPKQPVALVFAGKPHPADTLGIDIMQEILRHCTEERFLGRIFFLEDYSLAISRIMVQGCDVWLNTPRRPYEASGTSGQKAAVSGTLNLSISDGWWCEGYNGSNGWTIGPVVTKVDPSDNQSDYSDAEALYSLIEDHVAPRYYDRGPNGLPSRWIRTMKESMRTLIPAYNSNRMVRDYFEGYYEPTAQRHFFLKDSQNEKAKTLSGWMESLPSRFSTVTTGLLSISGIDGDIALKGDDVAVKLTLSPGKMSKEEIAVQFIVGPHDGTSFTDTPDVVPLAFEQTTSDGSLVFSCVYRMRHNGQQAYGVRVIPASPLLENPLASNLVIWA